MNDVNIDNYAHFGRVAVLMGGASAEREISLLSGNAVLNALKSQGVNAFAFDPAERSIFELKNEQYDRCFIALHGRYGEDGTIQGALELLGIPYTGSGVMASSVAMNKVMTKRIWQSIGLPTPKWIEVNSTKEAENAFKLLDGVMIIKPAREGSTIGLTKVTALTQCREAYELAAHQDSLVLCEQYISGDEVTCTILDSNDMQNKLKASTLPKALPIIRIIAPQGNYDYKNKYFTNETQYIIPCELPEGEELVIQALVLKSYQALGCRGWARADVMIEKVTRKPYLLEINTAPGMTNHSLVPMSAKEAGLNFEKLCLHVLGCATLDYSVKADV